MQIAVIGSGYVGLVTGVCFSEIGHQVICMDNDQVKINMLKMGQIPIWEPGLQEMVERNQQHGRLAFTTDIRHAVSKSEIVFIAVGTPPGEDGSADLQYVLGVARSIAETMDADKIIVDKSTVPVGTADKVKNIMAEILEKRGVAYSFSVVSNPEFLKEGAAIDDFMKPDRVVIGTDDPEVVKTMKRLYAPFNMSSDRVIAMSIRSAEMTKYAANAMLATKISFINEIAALCEQYGADVTEVRKGIGSDTRIGYHFIYPGVGYGGSCFPKDVKALIHMAESVGVNPLVLKSVEERNATQKKVLADKVTSRFGNDLTGLIFAVWGLSFKPNTDDMREAPSLVIIRELVSAGAIVRCYDPVAGEAALEACNNADRVCIINDQYEVCLGADALLMVTEWHQFRSPDLKELLRIMKRPIIFDGRNQYDPQFLRDNGFEYHGIGRH